MKILITGCAGFIGFHVTKKILIDNFYDVIGIDNLNNYYDIKLKKDRLNILKKDKKFKFLKLDICNENNLDNFFKKNKFDIVIHLAAQAGVRHSISNPEEYIKNNLNGFFNIINISNKYKINHFLYASTSSVYGDTKDFPIKEINETSKPLSFYAATKKSNEVIAHSFSNIFSIPTTGMRFFTVYGEWGRPDMALFKFTDLISKKKKIELYGYGKHKRDFTHVDDVSNFIVSLINKPSRKKIPFQVFNLSSNNPKSLLYFVKVIEKNLKLKSKVKKIGLQDGDVLKTHGSNVKIVKTTKIKPKISIEEGIKRFVTWYLNYYKKSNINAKRN